MAKKTKILTFFERSQTAPHRDWLDRLERDLAIGSEHYQHPLETHRIHRSTPSQF